MMENDAGETTSTIVTLRNPVYQRRRGTLTFFVEVHPKTESFPYRAGGVVDTFMAQPDDLVPSVRSLHEALALVRGKASASLCLPLLALSIQEAFEL